MDEPVTTPVTQGPVSEPKKPFPVRTAIIIAVVLAVAGIIAALLLIRIDGFTLLDRMRAQGELRGIMVADRSFESIVPRSFGLTGLADKEIAGISGTIGDYTAGGNIEAVIARSAESGAQEVWQLGGEPKLLATGPAAKASLAVSADGALLAYAARTDGAAGFAPALSSWTVHLVNVSTGRDVELGSGFDPEFFVRDGVSYLLYTSRDGVVVTALTDLTNFSGFITPFEFGDSIDFAAKVSADGAHIALKDTATRQYAFYSIYRATADMPLGIDPLVTPTNRYIDVIFAGKAAYGIDNITRGSGTVWKIDLTEAGTETKKYTFPTELANRFVR